MSDLVIRSIQSFAYLIDHNAPRQHQFQTLQQQVTTWATDQFGPAPDWQMALGMAEEIGELAGALVNDDRAGVLDACADWTIYAFNFCQVNGLDLFTLYCGSSVPSFTKEREVLSLQAENGKVQQAVLKRSQGIRGFDSLPKFLAQVGHAIGRSARWCETICNSFDGSYESVVERVTAEVTKRNWKQNPVTAADLVR